MRFSSIKFQIPFTILVFALSVIIITTLLLDNVTSNHLKENILERNLGTCEMIGEHIYLYLNDAKGTVSTAAKFASESNGNMEDIKREIFRIYDNFEYFDLIFFIDNDGYMLFSKPENEYAYKRYNYQDRDYFQAVMKNGNTSISNLHISRVLGNLHFIIASPVFNEENEIIGLIGAGIPLYNIDKVVKSAENNFNGRIYIVDSKGTILIHPDIDNIKKVHKLEDNPISPDASSMSDLAKIKEKRENTILSYQRDGKRYHSAISFVKEVNWMIIAEQSEETMLRETIWLGNSLKVISFGLVLIVIVIGLLLAQKITEPIEKLVNEVGKLGNDYEAANFINVQSNNEIGELAQAFNDMSSKLKEYIHRLNNSYIRENYYRQYLDNILKSLASGILVTDINGKITIFNDSAEKITGFPKEEYIGKDIRTIFDKLKINLEKTEEKIITREVDSISVERTIINKYGNEISISLFMSPVLENNEEVIGIIYLFNDISNAKKLEKELSRLDRMHILGELSASLIHDIGNPLSGMKNLLELAEANWQDEGLRKEIYDMLNKELDDLNDLVVNYLSFSRNAFENSEYTDIFNLIDEAVNLLRPEIINKDIQLLKDYRNRQYGRIKINRSNMKHALINIILNCIQASQEGSTISIFAIANGEEVKISIKDNGIGIKKEDMDKIFEPFYTTKKGGTGLGLSSAYKIIKEHDGYIDVKSKLGEGTQFSIVLTKDRGAEIFDKDIGN